MNVLIGDVIIGIGLFFMLLGVIGILRNKTFYTRILVTSKIDTVGAFTILLGVLIKHGFSFFSLKVLIIMGLIVVANPLSTHIITRAAHDCKVENKDGSDAPEGEETLPEEGEQP